MSQISQNITKIEPEKYICDKYEGKAGKDGGGVEDKVVEEEKRGHCQNGSDLRKSFIATLSPIFAKSTSVAYAIHFATVKSGSVVVTPRPKYSLRVIFSNTVVAILPLSDPSSFLGGVLQVDGMDDELMTEYMV